MQWAQGSTPASSSVQASHKQAGSPWLAADATIYNQRRSDAGVRPAFLSSRTHRLEGRIPMEDTLKEAEVEPLYKLLLKARRIRPLAYPEPTHLIHHPKHCADHQFVGHATSKCRALKERLEELI